MKVKKKEFERDGKGSVMLVPEESEDLWHLYNLVAAGDEVKARTYRKVMRDDGKAGSETKKLVLTIEVKNVEYDAEGDAIRFAGVVCEESEWVKMGAHHTIEIELNEALTITKQNWDGIYTELLKDATDVARAAEVAVVLMEAKDSGTANVSLLTTSLARKVGTVSQVLPKKRLTTTQLDKAMEKFFIQIYNIVKEKVNLDLVKCVVLGGPGATKTEFNKWCQTHAMQQGDSQMVKQKGVFVCVDTTSVHNQGLDEILADPGIQKRIGNTKAVLHVKALEECQRRLANSPEMACYGPKEVKKAFAMGAIDTMMISDALFRNASVQVRKEYVDFVQEVKDSGSTVYVFSSGHTTGQKLTELADIAANLRFQVEYDEVEDDAPLPDLTPQEGTQAATSSTPVKLDRTVSTASTASNSTAPKAGVAELLLALGGDFTEERVEKALSSSKGVAEDAFLVLLGEQLDGPAAEKKEHAAEPKKEAPTLAVGNIVEVVDEFASNSKTVVQLPKGKVGKVVTIDEVGDAQIDFGEGISKQWVKKKSFCHLQHSKATFEPPARSGAAPKTAAKAGAKQAPKQAAKQAPKPAAKKKKAAAAMQWDDYDYY